MKLERFVLCCRRQDYGRSDLGPRGRIANTAGDSVLAEFPSVVNAVECAVAVQEKLGEAMPDHQDRAPSGFASACTWGMSLCGTATCSVTA